jgi:antitoxin HicB
MTYYCTIEKEGDEYIAAFPDMPNIITCGFSQKEALAMAKEALDACLEADVSRGIVIPKPIFADGFAIAVASHIAIAVRLRELRADRTQSEIAEKLGLSYQAYQRLENPRKSNPTIKTLEKIANAFGRELSVRVA